MHFELDFGRKQQFQRFQRNSRFSAKTKRKLRFSIYFFAQTTLFLQLFSSTVWLRIFFRHLYGFTVEIGRGLRFLNVRFKFFTRTILEVSCLNEN